jgi:hypothetical protein
LWRNERAFFDGNRLLELALLATLVVVVVASRPDAETARRVEAKSRRTELVERIRVSLARAADAEKGAVLAITDEDSRAFADQARAATAEVQRDRDELAQMIDAGDRPTEKEALGRFSAAFSDFLKMDAQILDLAVRNTNIKAYQLAFGDEAQAVKEIDGALFRLLSRPTTPRETTLLAVGALSGVFRIQAMLPPHIAEESDQKMDQMEAQMAAEDRSVRKDLDALAAIPALRADPDLATARKSYQRFGELKAQILKLSRENTNVRSTSMTLDRERQRIFNTCQDAIDSLRQAVLADPAGSDGKQPHRPPLSPR